MGSTLGCVIKDQPKLTQIPALHPGYQDSRARSKADDREIAAVGGGSDLAQEEPEGAARL
jgi:hypothetical protein